MPYSCSTFPHWTVTSASTPPLTLNRAYLFDCFYETALQLLNSFYPERTITVTTRDPDYMTAGIKAKLRRKNRLMRAGRTEEAEALAVRIGKDIASRSKTH